MIFSIIAFATALLSVCITDRKKSLYFQAISCLSAGIFDYTIAAYTSAVLGVVNFIRTMLFAHKKIFKKTMYLILLGIFEVVLIVNCFYTWAGPISLLPTIASIIRTYCLWQSNMKFVRISGIITGVLYGSYYIYYQASIMFWKYISLMLVSIVSFYKNDLRKSKV